MTRRVLGALAALFALTLPAPAAALLCQPLLGCSCNVAAGDVAFGVVTPEAPATAVGDIQVSCSGVLDVLPSVAAQVGPGLYGSVANRRMQAAGGANLAYNLYRTPAYDSIVGQGTGGYAPLTISGGLLTFGNWTATAHLYGRIPATPSATPGAYADTVIVRIEW